MPRQSNYQPQAFNDAAGETQTQAVTLPNTGQAPTTNAPSVQTAPGAQGSGERDKSSAQTGAPNKVDELPEWAQAEIKSLRSEAAKRRKEAAAAEEANLSDKQLAEKRQAQLDELAPKSELADRLSEIVAKQLDAEISTWPDSVRAIMPDAKTALLERLQWAERTRPLAQELMAANGLTAPPAPLGTRFPAQHPGGPAAPVTTKTIADQTLKAAYAPRKAAQ